MSISLLSRGVWFGTGFAFVAACSAAGAEVGDRGSGSSSEESGGSGRASGSGSGAATGSGTTGTGGNLNIDPDAGSSGGACNAHEIPFEPQIPTVHLLVDRSSSMTDNAFWEPLRTAVLQVVEELQSEVRFGFATYTGTSTTCPIDYQAVEPIVLDNYGPISAEYLGQAPPVGKSETPTARAIGDTVTRLSSVVDPGDKFILLVTDGEPDFCDDGNESCRIGGTTGALQQAYAAGVQTLVFGLPGSSKPEIYDLALQDFANAGAGQPVSDHSTRFGNEGCLQEVTNNAGVAPTFSATDGAAPYYTPNIGDQEALVNAIRAAVSGVKSCVFDLGDELVIDLERVGEGNVYIEDAEILYNTPDGWHMVSDTQLELQGAACTLLRDPNTKRIRFEFPCDVIVPVR